MDSNITTGKTTSLHEAISVTEVPFQTTGQVCHMSETWVSFPTLLQPIWIILTLSLCKYFGGVGQLKKRYRGHMSHVSDRKTFLQRNFHHVSPSASFILPFILKVQQSSIY